MKYFAPLTVVVTLLACSASPQAPAPPAPAAEAPAAETPAAETPAAEPRAGDLLRVGHAFPLRSGLGALELSVQPRGDRASQAPEAVLAPVTGVRSVSVTSTGAGLRIRLQFLETVEPSLAYLPSILINAGYEVLEIELWAGGYLSRTVDGAQMQFRPSGWDRSFLLGGPVPLDWGHLGVHARVLRQENGEWSNAVGVWTIELLEWDT